MNKLQITIVLIVILIISYESYWTYFRSKKRTTQYNKAKTISFKKEKPLLVIGDPYNGAFNKTVKVDYGCGDLCIDITGCNKCSKGIKGKIEDELPKLLSNSYVIFISCTLEYVDDNKINDILDELYRVSGGDIYIVNIEPYSFISRYYYGKVFTGETGAKRIFYKCDFQNYTFQWKDLKDGQLKSK